MMVGIDILVVAEHDGVYLHPATRQIVTAAVELAFLSNGDVHVLVMGPHNNGVVEAAAEISGVMKILCADHLSRLEAVQLILSRSPSYGHVLLSEGAASENFAQELMSNSQADVLTGVAKVLALDSFETYGKGGIISTKSGMDPVILFVDAAAFEVAALFGHASIELLTAEAVRYAAKAFSGDH